MNRTKLFSTIIIMTSFYACKTPNLVGEYRCYSGNILNLNLKNDSSYRWATGNSLSSIILTGTWTVKGKYLYTFPIKPDDIYFDSLENKYKRSSVKKLDRVVADDIPYYDPSVSVYRVRRNRLYDSNENHKVFPCFYYKPPENIRKAKRLRRINEINCFIEDRHDRFLMRLRLIR